MNYSFKNKKNGKSKKLYFFVALIILVVWAVVAYKGVSINQKTVVTNVQIPTTN